MLSNQVKAQTATTKEINKLHRWKGKMYVCWMMKEKKNISQLLINFIFQIQQKKENFTKFPFFPTSCALFSPMQRSSTLKKNNPTWISYSHCNSVRNEGSSLGKVLKAAEEVLRADSIKLGVVFEGVNNTLTLNSISALHIIVIRQEDLLGPMKPATPSNWLLRAVVPPDTNTHPPTPGLLDALHFGDVRLPPRVRRPHQHAITSCRSTNQGINIIAIERIEEKGGEEEDWRRNAW